MAASTSSPPSPSMEDKLRDEPPQQPPGIHKTKLIEFLGRVTPIVLQNDNGPCPLLAICNVLLLKNNLTLSPDTTEVSQERLLALVADRVIDANSNTNGKDAGFIENQQRNIADAIDLLPRLATGIDVNIKFTSIKDFEYTSECAIFDLLDIPLRHGWIVDPEDKDTANAIAYKSYNTLTAELVALETQASREEDKRNPDEDDCVDFAAATTAALGVPSPCHPKARSFDDPSHPIDDYHGIRKGDLLEEEELSRVLRLSEAEVPSSVGTPPAVGNDVVHESVSLVDSKYTGDDARGIDVDANKQGGEESGTNISTASDGSNGDLSSRTPIEGVVASFSSLDVGDHPDQPTQEKSEEALLGDAAVTTENDDIVHVEDASIASKQSDSPQDFPKDPLSETVEVENISASSAYTTEEAKNQSGGTTLLSSAAVPYSGADSSNSRLQHLGETDAFTPSTNEAEPIYEGEDCILDSRRTPFGGGEPVYEGELVLASQADKSTADAHGIGIESGLTPEQGEVVPASQAGKSTVEAHGVQNKSGLTPEQGELVRNFLKNNASQLTFKGLFSLQDGLKERELCVFFRNNHFSTMFKFKGQLYLLATDQGYINQSDLVWEKLNEVNGDSLFMTGKFEEFNAENQSNSLWNENNAVASTADFLASIDNAAQAGLDVNSDLQLAIALQQQEFEQQQQQQQQQRHGSQQSATGSSRLVTGPQVPRNNARYAQPSNRPEAKSKDKCTIM